ncbi:MAG: sugar phosphate isomerase/epimerase [Clostridia bacterium]|nr:sugar phosphate isomerase/epimerase [Clostridia bacterium]
MKFGICMNYKQAMEEYPFNADYFEIAVWDLKDFGKEEIGEIRTAIDDGRIKTYSANGLFPQDLRLTGDVKWDLVREYCDSIFYKLDELDVKTVVFGSGKAKHVPDGFSREKAWEQLYELGDLLSDIAKSHGQTVVVEPLSYNEVNIVNTVEEGAEYCRKVNRDNFKLLVDFYHFDNNGEDWGSLEKNKDLLYHAHIASPKKRTLPDGEDDWDFFARCIKSLKDIGFAGGFSFEGGRHDGVEYEAMLTRMKAMS